MTTIKLSGGDLGSENMMVRCELSRAEAPVEVNYMTGDEDPDHEWHSTQYQCADVKRRTGYLTDLAKLIAARSCGIDTEEFDCNAIEFK